MESHLSYNRIASQSLERLAALSDGLFAIAMTLLVLDLRVPVEGVTHSDSGLIHALLALSPRLVAYLMSFMTLGIFWVGQQVQLSYFSRCNRHLTWIHFGFLLGVSLMPFSTALLAEYIQLRTALLIYWANIVLLGGVLYGSWIYACRAKLVKESVTLEVQCAVERRILVAQALYAFGAALCFFNTSWSIGWIVLLQLNFAIAPRIWFLSKI